MSDFSKLSVICRVSENSDYTAPFIKPQIPAYTSTPDEAIFMVVEATTAGTTVSISGLVDTVDYVIVYNDDGTDDVVLQHDTLGGHVATATSLTVEHDIGPGKFIVLPDVDPDAELVLDAEANTPRCYVVVVGT